MPCHSTTTFHNFYCPIKFENESFQNRGKKIKFKVQLKFGQYQT